MKVYSFKTILFIKSQQYYWFISYRLGYRSSFLELNFLKRARNASKTLPFLSVLYLISPPPRSSAAAEPVSVLTLITPPTWGRCDLVLPTPQTTSNLKLCSLSAVLPTHTAIFVSISLIYYILFPYWYCCVHSQNFNEIQFFIILHQFSPRHYTRCLLACHQQSIVL